MVLVAATKEISDEQSMLCHLKNGNQKPEVRKLDRDLCLGQMTLKWTNCFDVVTANGKHPSMVNEFPDPVGIKRECEASHPLAVVCKERLGHLRRP